MNRCDIRKAVLTMLVAALSVTACGKPEKQAETLSYQYYDESGELQLEFNWNEELQSGTGIFYSDTVSEFTVSECTEHEWQDRKWDVTKYGSDASGMDEYQENYEYNDQDQLIRFCSEGIWDGWEEPQMVIGIQIDFYYREDGTLERKECAYNPLWFETTRQSETYYYDEQERLVYTRAYITHGYLEDYYIYLEDENEPAYCLTVDHYSGDAYAGFVRYR